MLRRESCYEEKRRGEERRDKMRRRDARQRVGIIIPTKIESFHFSYKLATASLVVTDPRIIDYRLVLLTLRATISQNAKKNLMSLSSDTTSDHPPLPASNSAYGKLDYWNERFDKEKEVRHKSIPDPFHPRQPSTHP